MGRAHQKIPRIALVLNWVKKDSSEFYFKKSLSMNPHDLVTYLFLAEYYKESDRKQEAENLLLPVIKAKPRAEEYLEDERNLIKMKKLLSEL
jgi:tetratricopeptide (TPR) repeat protein